MLNYSVVWWSSDVEDERKRQNVQKVLYVLTVYLGLQ